MVLILGIIFWYSFAYMCHADTTMTSFDQGDIVIFDVDAGVDDALAILIGLKAEELKIGPRVAAVTCVSGNARLDDVIVNVQRTLQVAGRQDVPVYKGANSSLVYSRESDSAFGEDGFGDRPYDPSGLQPLKDTHAVQAIIHLVDSHPGKVVIVALGPLTNVALAERLSPGLLKKVKSILIMAGSCRGVGNIKPGIEFNSHMDPESFHIVVSNANYQRALILPWDPVVEGGVDRDWWVREFATLPNPLVQFIKDVEHIYVDKHPTLFYADAMLYVAYLQPHIKLDSLPLRITVVTDGSARGALLIDYYHADRDVNSSNCEVILKYDTEEYKKFIVKIFT